MNAPTNTPPVQFFGKSVTIACTDIERSRYFYETVLGAVLIPSDGYGCPWYQLGAIVISLMPNAHRASTSIFPEHAMPIFWLEVKDIQWAYEHLKRSNVPVIQAPDDDLWMLVTDPDGLFIEVWQRTDNG